MYLVRAFTKVPPILIKVAENKYLIDNCEL